MDRDVCVKDFQSDQASLFESIVDHLFLNCIGSCFSMLLVSFVTSNKCCCFFNFLFYEHAVLFVIWFFKVWLESWYLPFCLLNRSQALCSTEAAGSELVTQSAKQKSIWSKLRIIVHCFHTKCMQQTHFSKFLLFSFILYKQQKTYTFSAHSVFHANEIVSKLSDYLSA